MSDQDSAVGAESIETGVTLDPAYETLYIRLADRHSCDDPLCGRCGKSTAREPLPPGKYAADCDPEIPRDAETGRPLLDPEIRTDADRAYDPRFVSNLAEMLDASKPHDVCSDARCEKCNIPNLRPEYTIEPGGGSKSGRKPANNRPLTGQERIDRRISGSTPFDEGHTASNPRGRPLIGKEVRVILSVRVEPNDVALLRDKKVHTADIIGAFAEMLRMAKSNVEREAISDRMMELLDDYSRKDVA